MMCARLMGEIGLSRHEQFVRYLQHAPSRHGLLSGLGPTDLRPLFNVSQRSLPHI